jgi:hypothetical protein
MAKKMACGLNGIKMENSCGVKTTRMEGEHEGTLTPLKKK